MSVISLSSDDTQQHCCSVLPMSIQTFRDAPSRQLQDPISQSRLSYWSNHLRGSRPLALRTDYSTQKDSRSLTKKIPIHIDHSLLYILCQLAAAHETSLYVVLLAAYRTAIFRVMGEEDGAIGIGINEPSSSKDLLDVFGITHAIHLPITPQNSFSDVLEETSRIITAALEHSGVNFDEIAAHLSPQHERSQSPLVELMFSLHDLTKWLQMDSGEALANALDRGSMTVDLSLHLLYRDGDLRGYFVYSVDRFSSRTIQTLCDIYLRVIAAITRYPSYNIATLPLSRPDDLTKLSLWNATGSDYPSLHVSLGERFRQVVDSYGPSRAVVDASSSLTYTALNEQSDRLASWIVSRGLPAESVVGILMTRTTSLVVAYLACIKCGLPYMPLDTSLPLDRLRLMVEASRCQLILSTADTPLSDGTPTINILRNAEILISHPIISLPTIFPENLSNVVFTSGSTGVPKGVMVEHRGMVNLCAPETSNWRKKMKNALTTSIAFDPSGFQIFTSLLSGSELHCLPDNGGFDVDDFQNFVIESGVERIYTTPSILGALLEADGDWLERSSLKCITLGGEKLVPSDISELLRRLPHLEVSSSYGPAEASVRSAYYIIDNSTFDSHASRIPIGRALPNTFIYIVDETLSAVPAGVLGEIVVAGVHLARGYINRPDFTEERFVQAPDGSPLGPKRLYHTGDLGYWTSDGQVQFVGRIDGQLKIRGQRLEAGEVETILNRRSVVDSSVVTVVPTPQGEQLVAYVRLSADTLSREKGVLSLWENHYDDEESYGDLNDDAAGRDFTRWVSMYTGGAIPIDEMQEWLDDTIAQLSPVQSDHVLELGVGTGKIALNVIHRVTSFVGTDISSLVIRFMESQIGRQDLSHKLSVYRAAAHEFDVLPYRPYTLAVMNSVVQYFPSVDYLTSVITGIIDIMPKGRVFIGDIRSYALIPYHDLERALASLDNDSSVVDIREALQKYRTSQTELLLSPSFFLDLQAKLPKILHVEIKPKHMTSRNELSRYRYSAILHIGSRPSLVTPAIWMDCSEITSPISSLRRSLRVTVDNSLGAINIPVSDIQKIHTLLDVVQSSDPGSSRENVLTLRQRLHDSRISVESTPAALENMAQEEGWRVVLDYAVQGSSGTFIRAVFARDVSAFVGNFPNHRQSAQSYSAPTIAGISTSAVVKTLDDHLRKSLPAYMVPSEIITVEEFPLNNSGKLDRKVLSTNKYMERHVVERRVSRLGARTEMEKRILGLFARALNRSTDAIDIQDSFFTLGGHSLTATTVVAAIRRETGVPLSFSNFFRHPTVKAIASIISEEQPSSSLPQSKGDSIGASATIVVNTHSHGPTLFMFPETTGFASVYSSAFESISHEVVAFGDEHWGEDAAVDESIHSIVSTLIPRIREHQANGPYFLSGWSYGGYLALEAAIQLRAAGESIGLVMLFDSSVYDKALGDYEWRPDLDHLLTIVDDKDCWLRQFTRANKMISTYCLPDVAYTGRVLLIKAQRGRTPGEPNCPPSDPLNGWGRVLPQIEVLHFDSHHRSMFDSVHGPNLGTMIRTVLRSDKGE